MKKLVILLIVTLPIMTLAQERKWISASAAVSGVQMELMNTAAPSDSSGRHWISAAEGVSSVQMELMNLPITQTGTIPAREAIAPMPAPQWYEYLPPQPYTVPIAYQQPMYAVVYPSQAVTDWLFGTPRQRSIPAEMAAEPTPPPEPTPQPVRTVATEPAIMRPAAMQAGVIAAPAVRTRPIAERATAAAIPEMTVWDILNYWTRKILLTAVLLCIGAFAWYKEHAAKQQASRRLADLEQDMQRLDRLIYGDERKKGATP